MKRGTTWSYVIRVKDPETGISKPRWVGGFATEQPTTSAESRPTDASTSTATGSPLPDAMEIKPQTLLDYRSCIRLYVRSRIGHLLIQAVRPSTITKLYRDLLTSGGRDGKPLAVPTVTYLRCSGRPSAPSSWTNSSPATQ